MYVRPYPRYISLPRHDASSVQQTSRCPSSSAITYVFFLCHLYPASSQSSFRFFLSCIFRAKRVSNWYIPKKKVCACARVHVCTCARVHVCTRVRIILVLVCGIMYHIRTYLVSARLPRYVYVDTYVPGLHPRPQKKNRRPVWSSTPWVSATSASFFQASRAPVAFAREKENSGRHTQEGRRGMCSDTVSYTHLTLPTICSV